MQTQLATMTKLKIDTPKNHRKDGTQSDLDSIAILLDEPLSQFEQVRQGWYAGVGSHRIAAG